MTRANASSFEDRLYAILVDAANRGAPCPLTDDLVEMLGCESNSTPSECMVRLEAAGKVSVRRYRQHRVVTIVATGRFTAEPANPRPHWRDRPMGLAAGALKLIDAAQPGAAATIRALSAHRGVGVPDIVAEVMKAGLQAVRAGDSLEA